MIKIILTISLLTYSLVADQLLDKKVEKQCKYIIEHQGYNDEVTDSLLSGIVVGIRVSAYTGEFPEKWDNLYIYKLGCIGATHNKIGLGFYTDFITSVLNSKNNI